MEKQQNGLSCSRKTNQRNRNNLNQRVHAISAVPRDSIEHWIARERLHEME